MPHIKKHSFLIIYKTKPLYGWSFVSWGLSGGDSILLPFSDSSAQETFSTIKMFAFTLRATPNCSTKNQKSVSSILVCASNCFKFKNRGYISVRASSTEWKILKKGRIWIKIVTWRHILYQRAYACQILNEKLCNVSDFDLKVLPFRNCFKNFELSGFDLTILQRVKFWKKFRFQSFTLCPILLRGMDNICMSFFISMILNIKLQNSSDFECKVLQRCRFCIKELERDRFEIKTWQHVRF